MKILFVASECAPFIKTGGLADVIGAVPKALAELGIEARVMLPCYPALRRIADEGDVIWYGNELHGAPVQLIAAHADGIGYVVR